MSNTPDKLTREQLRDLYPNSPGAIAYGKGIRGIREVRRKHEQYINKKESEEFKRRKDREKRLSLSQFYRVKWELLRESLGLTQSACIEGGWPDLVVSLPNGSKVAILIKAPDENTTVAQDKIRSVLEELGMRYIIYRGQKKFTL